MYIIYIVVWVNPTLLVPMGLVIFSHYLSIMNIIINTIIEKSKSIWLANNTLRNISYYITWFYTTFFHIDRYWELIARLFNNINIRINSKINILMYLVPFAILARDISKTPHSALWEWKFWRTGGHPYFLRIHQQN